MNCGSNRGLHAEYADLARDLGRVLAKSGIELVYGGAYVGLMGEVANSTLEHGGRVIGVIPASFADRVGHTGLVEIHVVDGMHERKTKMFDLSDGFIALPGGFGTLEELMEILTWAQLGFHKKPCGLLNGRNYFDHLLTFLDHAVGEHFIKPVHREMLLVDDRPEELLRRFQQYEAPVTEKWMDI